jgi:hypothetical protein
MFQDAMATERRRRPSTSTRLYVAQRWLSVEDRGVRAREADTGSLTPEQLFAVVLLWEAPGTSQAAWIGWMTTVNHRSACFCAADLHDARFRQWLADLPGWEPDRLAFAIENPGLHLLWRRGAN